MPGKHYTYREYGKRPPPQLGNRYYILPRLLPRR